MSGVFSKEIDTKDKYVLTLFNFSTWIKHWDEVEFAQYGSLLGRACKSGVRPTFTLPMRTDSVIVEIQNRDGSITTFERPQDEQNKRILLAEKVADKKKFLEGEAKACTAIIKTISDPVIAKIKLKNMEEYMEAVNDVDVVKLISIVRSVCQSWQ